MKSYVVTIQMKPLQQNCHVVLFFKYVVLTFETVNEILCCYHSNETYLAVLCIVLFILGILEEKKLEFFSEFYLWSLVEILSKFKVILNVIFR